MQEADPRNEQVPCPEISKTRRSPESGGFRSPSTRNGLPGRFPGFAYGCRNQSARKLSWESSLVREDKELLRVRRQQEVLVEHPGDLKRSLELGNFACYLKVARCSFDYSRDSRKAQEVGVIAVTFGAHGGGTHRHSAVFGQKAATVSRDQARANPFSEGQKFGGAAHCSVGSGPDVRNGGNNGIAVDEWPKAGDRKPIRGLAVREVCRRITKKAPRDSRTRVLRKHQLANGSHGYLQGIVVCPVPKHWQVLRPPRGSPGGIPP